jgi:hypothetical protein
MSKKYPIKQVPCDGCTLCCQSDAIRLEREDSPTQYKTEPHPFIAGALMLAHRPDGECIYLENGGCSIHDHAPSLCRLADCRSLALRIDYDTARRLHLMNRLDIRVWDQGHKLLEKTTFRDGNKNVYHGEKRLTSTAK